MANGNPVILGNADTSTKQTTVTAITPTQDAGLRVQNYSGNGIAAGSMQGTALTAGSVGGAAIVAESFAGLGIDANCVDRRDIPGVSVAVHGKVQGGLAVLGENMRGRFPHAGVAGRSLLGIGVDGISRTNFGVRGMTMSNAISGAGVMGIGSPGHGVVGIARQTATTPVVPPPFVQGGPLFAGLFFGNVQVQGDFTVTGNKSAVVPLRDGTHRRLYCVESPEAWFEDFGTGELVKGRAVIAIEPTFARLIAGKDHHVFLTPEGDCKGLYVKRKGSTSFEVRELQKGTSSIGFSYRIVARRRDVQGKRLEVVELGHVPEATAHAELALPKSFGKNTNGALTGELEALAKQGKMAKPAVSRTQKK